MKINNLYSKYSRWMNPLLEASEIAQDEWILCCITDKGFIHPWQFFTDEDFESSQISEEN